MKIALFLVGLIALFLVGLIALMLFNTKIMAPLFGDDTGGLIGLALWSFMTGLIYAVVFFRRMQ